jgi:hypothetical protein
MEVTAMNQQEMARLRTKTPEQQFLYKLEAEFAYAPRVARAVLAEARECLFGHSEVLRPGQMRVLLARRGAAHGRPLAETEKVEVVWTIDDGIADAELACQQGAVALRRERLRRLLEEALEQGGVATQEDVARALQVSVRTIRRDCAALRAAGERLPTRGQLQGIGRGQTHKAQIVGRWLAGETYDQIAVHTHHSLASIQRYIQTFVRVVHLHEQAFSREEIGLLLQLGPGLVAEYLALYHQADSRQARRRLAEQLRRLGEGQLQGKKGGI